MNLKPYVVASAYFILLVFLFQALSLNMGFSGELYSNRYDVRAEEGIRSAVRGNALESEYLLVGSPGQTPFDSMRWMMESLKMPVRTAEKLNLAELDATPTGILVATADIDSLGDLESLQAYVHAGGLVLFAQVPQPVNDENYVFFEEMGILSMGELITYEQCEFYEGLLIGGMVRYKELPILAQQMRLSSLCKIRATMWDGDPDAREDEVPLVYEKRSGQGVYCVVNAPLLSGVDGIGILTGLLAQGRDALITPAVNACSMSLLNFPTLAGDAQLLQSAYARDALKANRDVLWPDLTYLLRSNDVCTTAFLPAGISAGGGEQQQLLSLFMRGMSEASSELGVTQGMAHLASLQSVFPQYGFFVTYGDMPEAGSHAVVRDLRGDPSDFHLLADGTVRYPILTSGYEDSDRVNLRARSFASGLFMIHHAVDLAPPILLQTPEDNWQELNRPLASFVSAAIRPYPEMARLRISDAALNMMRFSLATPRYIPDDQGVTIDSGLAESSYFLLRTRRTIASTQGMTVTPLEEGVYLIALHAQQGRIAWKDVR